MTQLKLTLAALLTLAAFPAAQAQSLFDSGAATATAQSVTPKVTQLSPETKLLQFDIKAETWAGAAQVQGQWLLLEGWGDLYRSPNGATWEKDIITPATDRAAVKKTAAGTTPFSYTTLLSNGKIAIASGFSKADSRISYDGRTWFLPKSAALDSLSQLKVQANGNFTVVDGGWSGKGVLQTADWDHWETIISGPNSQDSIQDNKGLLFTANGLRYVVTSKGGIFSSRTGLGWKKAATTVGSGTNRDPIAAYGNGIAIIASTEYETHTGVLARNAGDGNWVTYTIPGGGTGYTGLTFDRGRFVAITAGNADKPSSTLWSSTDALTWTPVATLPDYKGQPWHKGMTQPGGSIGIGSYPAKNLQTIASGPDGFLIPGPGGQAVLYSPPALPDSSPAQPGTIPWNAPSFVKNSSSAYTGITFVGDTLWAHEGHILRTLKDGAWQDIPLPEPNVETINDIASLGNQIFVNRNKGYHTRTIGEKDWKWIPQHDLGSLSSNSSTLLSWSYSSLQTLLPKQAGEFLRSIDLVRPWLDGETIAKFVQLDDRALVLTNHGGLYQSADYKTWTLEIAANGSFKRNSDFKGIAQGNGQILAYSGYKSLSFFNDTPSQSWSFLHGANDRWDLLKLPDENSVIQFAGYRKGLFIVLLNIEEGKGSYQALYTTPDGKTWNNLGWFKDDITSYALGEPGLYLATKDSTKAALIDLPTAPETKTGHGLPAIAPIAYQPPPIRYKHPNNNEDFMLRDAKTGSAYHVKRVAALLAGQDSNDTYVENPEQAEFYFKKGIEAGQLDLLQGYSQLLDKWLPSRSQEKVALLKTHADSYPEAAYLLAAAYNKGSGTDANKQTAIQWLEKAAALGRENTSIDLEYLKNKDASSPEALFAIAEGLNQEKSDIAPLSKSNAFFHYWQAAGKAYIPAMHSIIRILGSDKIPTFSADQKALLVPPYQDTKDKNVRIWLDEGAKLKDPLILRVKGQQVSGGNYGYEKDNALAFSLIQEAANLKELDALYLMGECYAKGIGVEKNEATAKDWFQKAVDAGHANAAGRIQELDTLAKLASETAAPDGQVTGLSPKVIAVLKPIQDSAITSLKEVELINLFQAIWSDANYDSNEADLAQELATLKAGGSLTLADTASGTLTFTKPLDATVTPGFANFFPTPFNPSDIQYLRTVWSLGKTGGPLLYFHRQAIAANNQELANNIVNSLAQTAFEAAQKDGVYTNNPLNFIAVIDDYLARAATLDEAEAKEFKALAKQGCQLVNARVQNKWSAQVNKLD